jgi:hypothetical protein
MVGPDGGDNVGLRMAVGPVVTVTVGDWVGSDEGDSVKNVAGLEVGLAVSMIGGSNDPEVAPASRSESSPAKRAFSCKAVSKPPLSISLSRLVVTSSYSSFVSAEHSSSDKDAPHVISRTKT